MKFADLTTLMRFINEPGVPEGATMSSTYSRYGASYPMYVNLSTGDSNYMLTNSTANILCVGK